MALVSNRITAALRRQARHGIGTRFAPVAAPIWRMAPPALRRRLRGNTGRRFLRFVPVSVAALGASLVANALFLGPAHMTAGKSGGLAAMVGAAVSYVLSRWAWERKGRPHLLKETLPFWLVSVGAWVVLGLSNKLGVYLAATLGLTGAWRVLVAEAVYLFGNCLTFLARFVIFHYVLFAGPAGSAGSRRERSAPAGAAASPAAGGEPGEEAAPVGEEPFIPAGE